jgi:uncharacterized protein YhfF
MPLRRRRLPPHPSANTLWKDYLRSQPPQSGLHGRRPPDARHLCDNETDADACARLVLLGRKRATAPSLWSFERTGEPLPEVGDLDIVADWRGHAVRPIRTTWVRILVFDRIAQAHARIEGEGNGSLAWWRRAHRDDSGRESVGSERSRTQGMPIVFQAFERIFPPAPG